METHAFWKIPGFFLIFGKNKTYRKDMEYSGKIKQRQQEFIGRDRGSAGMGL